MTKTDQKILFTSLGFLAVTLRGETNQADSANRARGLAWLIEEFCKTSIPEAFGETKDYSGDNLSDEQVDDLIAAFKERLSVDESAELPDDRVTLVKMHKRLEERYQDQARASYPDELLADLILKMIDAELQVEGVSK